VILSFCPSATQRCSRSSQLYAALAVAALIAGVVTAAPFIAPREQPSTPQLRETPRSLQAPTAAIEDPGVSILVYHRFGPAVKDGMTVRTSTFRWQIDYLKQHHHPIIPLPALISYQRGQGPAPPPGSVVITADDGHESVVTDMLPVVREYHVPVTLFIYPSAISNASYAMTWSQLDALHRTGLFDIQSHTYWHPNFKTEKRRLSPTAYRKFAAIQLVKSRTVLEDKLGVEADLVAWPFGIYDDALIGMARDAGYIAGFTLDRRLVTRREQLMALPRFLVTDSASGRNFTSMLPQEHR
jgi:peptidoglycan/xylan/chitin deacetylase (PgdA/CDA1 family)